MPASTPQITAANAREVGPWFATIVVVGWSNNNSVAFSIAIVVVFFIVEVVWFNVVSGKRLFWRSVTSRH